MAIGNRLKQLLDERGMTVKDFAQQIDVPPTTLYSFIKRDGQDIKMDLLMKICCGLGVNLDDLVHYEKPNDNQSSTSSQYYLNDDARDLAQFMFENPEYKVLFDASRKVKKEDIDFVKQMIDRVRGDSDDAGC